MTVSELMAKWRRRQLEDARLGGLVPLANVAAEVLEDLEALASGADVPTVTPTQAAALTHYHPESICRLIRQGKVKNYGTKHRPRVRLDELPRKAAPSAPEPPPRPRHVAGSITAADDIARDAIAGRIGRR